MDMDLDVMYDDVRGDEENLGFVQGVGFITVSEILDVLVYKMLDFQKLEIWNPNNEVSEISEFLFGKNMWQTHIVVFKPMITLPRFYKYNT